MAIIFTGATGFLGSHLLARFLLSGSEAVALVRRPPETERARLRVALSGTDHPLAAELVDNVRLVQVSLSSPRLGLPQDEFLRLASEVESIWHCAANIELTANPTALHHVNVMGTRTMLTLADAAGEQARFVHVSTAFVAGGRLDGVVGESDLED